MKIFFALLVCILTWSCHRNQTMLDKPGLISYLEDDKNGLTKSVSKGKYFIQTSYRPFDLIWHEDLQDDAGTPQKKYDYFILRISNENQNPTNVLAGTDEYLKANLYLNQLNQNVRLITSSDTLKPIEALASPMYGATPQASVLLAFDVTLIKETGDIRLIFDDQQFKTGRSEFYFDAKNFKNIPTLIPQNK